MISPARLTLVAAAVAAAGGVGEVVRRRWARNQPPPLTTQSSPGQIADLQQAYGADMADPFTPPSGRSAAAG
jgi:hypothetical protein